MHYKIKKYPVKHPLLKNYIKFFWELHIENVRLDHKIIPQRNINLRFSLNDTPQYAIINCKEHLLEKVFFSGLQDQYMNVHMKLNGKVDMLGVCFMPEGFYPFLRIPVSEFKNQLLGAAEAGFRQAAEISDKLRGAADVTARINMLEKDLILLLDNCKQTPESFRYAFNVLKRCDNPLQVSEFCRQNNIGLRRLERMYNKYIGLSIRTYTSLNRFQNSVNQILYNDFSKLSDIAYENGYYDQMHFIREFKRYTGNTPKSFIRENNSMLQIGKLI